MRLKFSLFDLLVILTPAVAIFLGIMTAVLQSGLASTIAQGIFLLSTLAAISFLFHRRSAVRAFCIVFLVASLTHLWLTHTYGSAFVTGQILSSIYANIQTQPSQQPNSQVVTTTFIPLINGGGWPTYSGGFGSSLQTFPTQAMVEMTPAFVQAGNWCVSFLLGIVCGLFAKAMKTAEEQETVSNPATT